MKTIEVIVNPQGETQVQTKGFEGSSCQQASRFLEQVLGKRTGEQLTAEYFSTTTQQQHEEQPQ